MRGVTRCREQVAARQSISTRTPHAGSDHSEAVKIVSKHRFQPALPMRGVTGQFDRIERRRHISTRTPHAGSDL